MKKLLFALSVILLGITSACTKHASNLKLPAIFSDNMVLQQNSNVAIWGTARAKSKVTVETSMGISAVACARMDGKWLMKLPTSNAGDPFDLTIKNDDSTLVFKNVLLGEVWLCSGQSNMEMPLAGWPPTDTIKGSADAIANSNNSEIRMFTVVRNVSHKPLNDCMGSWLESNPENAPGFSATAYFFAKKLYNELQVPIGLIHSSWGGTPVESWISGSALSDDSDFGQVVSDLSQISSELEEYDEWMKSHKKIEVAVTTDGVDPIVGVDFYDVQCADPALDVQGWNSITLPAIIENSEIGEFDGVVWFRKDLEIPEQWHGKDLEIHLGAIDDRDVTYCNGIRVGAYEEGGYWQKKRIYTLPKVILKDGKATIAIRLMDMQGGGGFTAAADEMYILPKGESTNHKIVISGDWNYRVVAEFCQNAFYLFDPSKNEYATHPIKTVNLGPYTATSLYNAMIAPLVPYTLKGSIWYQGEANVGRATQYARIFPTMIKNWRKDFRNPEMPFYFVQLAPWRYGGFDGTGLGNLRDAQRRTLALKNTGMAVTLDIGNYENIHPCHKLEVGERLAFWALNKTYKKDVVPSGPLFKSFKVEKQVAKVQFLYAETGLILKNNKVAHFEMAGEDSVFYPAKVSVQGAKIWLTSNKVEKPEVVRYAFRNGHEAVLFNGKGLPASSFTSSKIPEN